MCEYVCESEICGTNVDISMCIIILLCIVTESILKQVHISYPLCYPISSAFYALYLPGNSVYSYLIMVYACPYFIFSVILRTRVHGNKSHNVLLTSEFALYRHHLLSLVTFQAINDMIKDFEKSNITLKATETFRSFGEDLQAKMNQLKVQ